MYSKEFTLNNTEIRSDSSVNFWIQIYSFSVEIYERLRPETFIISLSSIYILVTSYDVYISQLVPIARICNEINIWFYFFNVCFICIYNPFLL